MINHVLIQSIMTKSFITTEPRRVKYFSIDATNDGFDHECSQPLSWRDDPCTSLSDWKIEASAEAGKRTYNVHRAILGAGSRKCLYFTTLFHQPKCVEHENSTSHIEFMSTEELDELELFLDFVYSGKFVPGENAVIARHLAFYFQCMEFMNKVNQFISRDLTPKRAPWYLLEATKYNDERLVNSATSLCAQALKEVDDKDLEALSVDLFKNIVDCSDLHCSGRILSLKVYTYLSHQNQVTPKLLRALTKDQVMGELDVHAARGFLRIMKSFDTSNEDWPLLVSLAKRCTNAIALNGWRTIDVDSLERDFAKDWKEAGEWHQRSDFALYAMSSALSRAQEVCTMQEWEIQNLKSELERAKSSERKDRAESSPPSPPTENFHYFTNTDGVLEAFDTTIEETLAQTLSSYFQDQQHWARNSDTRRR
jgi:hypothetical protein